MDGIDPRHDLSGLLFGAEAKLQHRIERAVEPPEPATALDAKRAVISDASREKRMRELQENRRAPREKQDDLPLHLPSDGLAVGTGSR